MFIFICPIYREFESSGLAKYGFDLTDDADDMAVISDLALNSGFGPVKPSLDTIAYDSELDNMSN